jgi:hypothetical protein
MRTPSGFIVPLLTVAVLQSCPTWAADDKKSIQVFKSNGGNQDIFAYDFGVPQAPALLLLGIQPGSVTPASSLKAFVGQIGNAVGSSGQSFALDISPAALTGSRRELGRYLSDRPGGYWYRLLRRSHVGVAGLLGSAGENSVKSGVSFGLTVSLLESSDPLRAKFVADGGSRATLQSCISEQSTVIANLAQNSPGLTAPVPGDERIAKIDKIQSILSLRVDSMDASESVLMKDVLTDTQLKNFSEILPELFAEISSPYNKKQLDEFNDKIQVAKREILNAPNKSFAKRPEIAAAMAQITKCAKRASNAAAFGNDLSIGGGTFWRGKPGEFSEFTNGGGAIWAAFRTSFATEWSGDAGITEPTAAWIIAATTRYGFRETIATGDKTVANIRADTLDGWLGIERRSPDFLASARIGYQQVRANETVGRFFNRQGTRFLLNAQQRVTDQMWLGVSYGNAGGTVDTYDANRFLVTVSFSPPKPDKIAGN